MAGNIKKEIFLEPAEAPSPTSATPLHAWGKGEAPGFWVGWCFAREGALRSCDECSLSLVWASARSGQGSEVKTAVARV